jgi:WD40 repeat protein
MLNRSFTWCLLALFCAPLGAYSQQNCPLPPSLQPIPSGENIFSDAQEVDLGDAMAEAIALHVNVIQDDELTAHLRDIGNRLVQHLPPTQLKFRFYLIDLPQVNAFSIAGGRIYISRKVVAFAQSDDELAGILAHEMGHIVTHQSAIEMTHGFREVLGVTQVGDRDDIFKKFHQYVENVARHPRRGHGEGEKQQIVADQVGLFTLARAGFAPQAAADMWDRFTGLHGKTGGWLSDLFGATTPDQHRLREMVKNMATLPPGCTDRSASPDEASFKSWQEAVVDYDNAARPESLPGILIKRRFSARLRPEIVNLRFSPDGQYILAQDDGGINVVSHNPFAFLFYIPAPDAYDAHFSPDSKFIAFYTSGLRVEVWSLVDQKRKSVHEITLRVPCLQVELSPNGNTLGCLNSEFGLLLVDVETSTVIQEKKAFFAPSYFEALLFTVMGQMEVSGGARSLQGSLHLIGMGFSPDGHYFLAGHARDHLLYDLGDRREIPIPNSIKDITTDSFAFLGQDSIVGINLSSPQKSHVVKFPSGEKLKDVPFSRDVHLRAAAHGDFLIVGPVKDYPLAIIDLDSKEDWIGIKQRATDMYDGVFVIESANGELALHTKDGALVAALQLPESSLGRLVATAVSSDLNYLAVATRTRGAVWDLVRNIRAFQTRNFNAAGLDGPAAYADFPKFEEAPREIVQLRVDTGATGAIELKDDVVSQHGLYLLVAKARNKDSGTRSNADIEIRDVRSGKTLWSRYFPQDLPVISFNAKDATMLLLWTISSPGGHDELARYSQLKGAPKDDYICEVLDANSGTVFTSFILKTNNHSLRYLGGSANRNWAVMEAAGDQIIPYALPSGEEHGSFFGSRPVLSPSGLLAVDSERREITLYDLATSEPRQQYVFAQPVALKAFSGDGKRLLVFTNEQTVYILNIIAAPANGEPASASKAAN